jgi:CMP-N-acetylneuraminic acid synthetase
MEINALVIIPAKADSTRLPGKNKRIIAGKTLLEHAIQYAKKSQLVAKIIVSTEDNETKAIAESYGIHVVGREADYMGEREVADVYVKIFNDLNDKNYTHVVGVQPDHPDRSVPLDDMLQYAVKNKYDDLFTVNPDGSRNGSIRITKAIHVASGWMSRRVGSMLDVCTNIHSEQDLLNAEKNILQRSKAK